MSSLRFRRGGIWMGKTLKGCFRFAQQGSRPRAEAIETEFPLESFPPPQELWKRYKQFRGIADKAEELVFQPYHDDPSGQEPRYYQVDAINRTIEAVADVTRRVLLVMATGTGKTYTTFQIIWRLWKADVVKRVLFWADRNILVDQTLVNDFKPFGSELASLTANAPHLTVAAREA